MNKWISYVTTVGLSLLVIGLVVLSQKSKKHLAYCAEKLSLTQNHVRHLIEIDSMTLLQFEYDHIKVDTGLALINSYGKVNQFSSLTNAGTLVFRFFTETCMSCYDQNIQLLKNLNNQETIPLLVLTNANSINELRKLEHLLQVSRGKIYMIKDQQDNFLDIDSYAKPYYSWIDSSGVTSHFFIVRQGNSDFTKSYLSIIANKQTKTELN